MCVKVGLELIAQIGRKKIKRIGIRERAIPSAWSIWDEDGERVQKVL